ncbi:MAG: site-specific integrase, partial [Segatella oulorum]|uniref:site-specific integrase n=1 Tax=Segatella oulorum TaxID=28136 RepID=UPI00360DD62F
MTTEQFLNYLQYELNRSELTIASYGDDLRAFEAFFKNKDTQLSWEAVDAGRDVVVVLPNSGTFLVFELK